MRRWQAAAAAIMVLLAGCASTSPATDPAVRARDISTGVPNAEQPSAAPTPNLPAPPVDRPTTTTGPSAPPATEQPMALGAVPAWPPLSWTGTCPCPPLEATLEADGGSDEWLEVRVLWDGTQTADVALSVKGPDGRTTLGERGFDERRVQVFSPMAGRYLVELLGEGDVEVRLASKNLDGPAGAERLPNLVTMRPQSFRFAGCDEVERIEQGATRCLRFGNGIGNTGNGPLQVRLDFLEGATAPLGGRFVQEVLQADGTYAEHEVAAAQFHPSHGHWHYEGVASFALHRVDPGTGLRHEEVAAHHKAGFCLLDWNPMESPDTVPDQARQAETACLIPGLDGWTMGVSVGWYDFYWYSLTDQYVDVAGVPDGLYEFVSVADGFGTLKEWDETDNAASMLIAIRGDSASVVESRAYYQVHAEDQD